MSSSSHFCCCCISLRTGVRLICIILIAIELGLFVHNAILVDANNGHFLALTGRSVDNYYIQMAVIVFGYSVGIMTNVVLLWATATDNKWLILPWLVFYVLVIFAILCSAPIIIIWFVWLQPAPIWALLSLASITIGLMLLYFWFMVNRLFMVVSLNASSCK